MDSKLVDLKVVCPKCGSEKDLAHHRYLHLRNYHGNSIYWSPSNIYDREGPGIIKCFNEKCEDRHSVGFRSAFVDAVAQGAFEAGRQHMMSEVRNLIGAASFQSVNEARSEFVGHAHCNNPRHEGM